MKFHYLITTTMKKTGIILFLLLISVAFKGFSQITPLKDFYAGKWEISLTGTPNGDVKFLTNLIRKDGKLTGELVNPNDAANGKRTITKVEESGDKMAIFFPSSQGDEVSIDLAKIDNDNLKGNLMGMFEAKARRIKD
jgi:hypothetical protein